MALFATAARHLARQTANDIDKYMPYSSVPPAEFVAPEFVDWFRSVAPYINAFRGRTFVVAFGGEVVADGKFIELTHDFNLLASLGVRLVLVHGARPQIEQHLSRSGIEDRYHQASA